MTKKILIIQLRKLGDVLLTTPVIDVLKEKYPNSEIDFFTEKPFSDIVNENPKVSNVFLLEKDSIKSQISTLLKMRKRKYDYVLDFFGNPRSAWWTFFSGAKYRLGYDYPVRNRLYNMCVKRDRSSKYVVDFKMDLLKPLGIQTDYRDTSLYVNDKVRQNMKEYLLNNGWNGKDKIVGLVTPNNRDVSRVKNWRKEGFIELANRLQREDDVFVLILWGPGEEPERDKLVQGIDKKKAIVSPLMSIKELTAMIEYCSVVVTACGGSKHIAVSQGVPTVTIFGPTQEICWNPPTKINIAVKAEDLECLACDQTSCTTMECMKQVSVDMVYNAVKKVL